MTRLGDAPTIERSRASRRGPAPTVRLLVCGNGDRGDDGAALSAIARTLPALPQRVLDRIEVRRCDALRVEDLVDIPSGMSCLIVDAVVGIEPGSVVRMSLVELGRPEAPAPRSSHQLPIGQVIALAKALRGRIPHGSFVGIAGRSFGYGTGLSSAVRRSLPAFGEAVSAEIDRLVEWRGATCA